MDGECGIGTFDDVADDDDMSGLRDDDKDGDEDEVRRELQVTCFNFFLGYYYCHYIVGVGGGITLW